MKIRLVRDGLIIVPETEFEESYMRRMNLESADVFHKNGVCSSDYIGIKIKVADNG